MVGNGDLAVCRRAAGKTEVQTWLPTGHGVLLTMTPYNRHGSSSYLIYKFNSDVGGGVSPMMFEGKWTGNSQDSHAGRVTGYPLPVLGPARCGLKSLRVGTSYQVLAFPLACVVFRFPPHATHLHTPNTPQTIWTVLARSSSR